MRKSLMIAALALVLTLTFGGPASAGLVIVGGGAGAVADYDQGVRTNVALSSGGGIVFQPGYIGFETFSTSSVGVGIYRTTSALSNANGGVLAINSPGIAVGSGVFTAHAEGNMSGVGYNGHAHTTSTVNVSGLAY